MAVSHDLSINAQIRWDTQVAKVERLSAWVGLRGTGLCIHEIEGTALIGPLTTGPQDNWGPRLLIPSVFIPGWDTLIGDSK